MFYTIMFDYFFLICFFQKVIWELYMIAIYFSNMAVWMLLTLIWDE